jgi:hypothetical protein
MRAMRAHVNRAPLGEKEGRPVVWEVSRFRAVLG